MTDLSQDDRDIIAKYPLNNSLDHLQDALRDAEQSYRPTLISYDGAMDSADHACQEAVSYLLSTLMGSKAAHNLRSRISNRDLASDLSNLFGQVRQGDFSYEHYRTHFQLTIQKAPDVDIWTAVINLTVTVLRSTPPSTVPFVQQTPLSRNMSSFVNSSEYRNYVDHVLKEELGTMYIDVPGFYEAFFGDVTGLKPTAKAVFKKCTEGDNPLYCKEGGWRGWPEHATEKDVLNWFSQMTRQLVGVAEECRSTPKIQRRPLAQPNQPLEGSTADRKLDIGFVDDPKAGENSKCHWSQILIPGELKSNPSADVASTTWLDLGRYAREVLAAQDTRHFVLGFTLCGSIMRLWEFDRLGGIASAQFNINQDGLQFVSVVLGFLWMNEEQLGYDPTIITTTEGKRYIEIERNSRTERIILDQLMKRAPCIAGRATTCWKAHCEGDDTQMPLVVKDSWQYPERDEEGELLREATGKGVINVARYYHHETVCVGGKDSNILNSIRKGLDITKAANYKPDRLMPLLSTSTSKKGRSGSTTGQKQSASSTNAQLPPHKRTKLSSRTKAPRSNTVPNRVHRRVIVRDYGKAIYKASSQVALLEALEGCLEGYKSLHQQVGMLQCDISPNNLMLNEEGNNPSWRSFLIDLDLAIKEQRVGFSGARGKTGTLAFMAIGVLSGENHSFMHDLESFFWVLFWICIHYDAPNKGRVVPEFDEWNYMATEKLAMMKLGVIADEDIFLKTITEYFTEYHQPLIPWVNRLRRVVFPGNGKWKRPNQNLYSDMKEILRKAQDALKDLGA